MDANSWRAVQLLLSKLIRAPEGVQSGLTALDPNERLLWENLIHPHGALTAVERLEIYANMYFYRLHDVLAEDFPTVRAVIGPERFHNLVTDYLLAHPSRHFSLRYAGKSFPAFVRQHQLCQRWPWLGDLALLEWAVVDAFDAPDAPAIGPEVFLALPAEVWGKQRIVWSASLQVLACAYPVHVPWQQEQDNMPLSDLSAAPTWLRVWRQHEKVFVAPVTPDEARVLGTSLTLAELAADLAAQSDEATAAEQLATWMADWAVAGLIAGLDAVTCRE